MSLTAEIVVEQGNTNLDVDGWRVCSFWDTDSEGMEFGMPVMDNFKFLQKNFNFMKKWVGKTATFTYFEKTKRGSYRHPLFKCLRNYE